jgi:hypothetical protein
MWELTLFKLNPFTQQTSTHVPASAFCPRCAALHRSVCVSVCLRRIGMWELKLMNLETGDFEEPPTAHWAMVADHIQLPPQMRESAIACYSLYLEYVEKVKQDRIDVLRDFQLLEQQLDAAAGGRGCAPPTLQYRVDGYEEYQELLDRLQLSLKREHMVANMLSYSLSQIASHVQMAKGMLACWPYWPDGPSVLTFWLAEEQARAQLLPGRQPGM